MAAHHIHQEGEPLVEVNAVGDKDADRHIRDIRKGAGRGKISLPEGEGSKFREGAKSRKGVIQMPRQKHRMGAIN